MVDSKPLLQDRPPAYTTVPGAYEYGPPQPSYGAIPPPAPPPYPYPDAQAYPSAQMSPAIAQQPYTGTYTIIQPSVVVVGGCPACRKNQYCSSYTGRGYSEECQEDTLTCFQWSEDEKKVGVLEDDFTCLGILCAIFFFPLGLLFCFALRQRRCPNCGATFG